MSFFLDVKHQQRLLAFSGFSPGPIDGRWGPKTEAAERAFLAAYEDIKRELGAVDPRSESCIMTLVPEMQRAARGLLRCAKDFPLTVRITSGTRTYAEQDALYAQGRTRSGPIVTQARGGESNHNFGIAFDVGIFDGRDYVRGRDARERALYAQLAELAKRNVPGIEWGGDWLKFKDIPHYQLATGHNISEIRRLFEAGEPLKRRTP